MYSDEDLQKQLAFSMNKGKTGSYIFDVKPQKSPYYLVVTFTRDEASQECASFELKVEIETAEKTVDKLKCKAKSHKDLLPPSKLSSQRKPWKTGGDSYACLLYTSPSPRDS